MLFIYTQELRYLREFFFERLNHYYYVRGVSYLQAYRSVRKLILKLLVHHTALLNCTVLIKSSGNFHDYGGLRTKTHWLVYRPCKLVSVWRVLDSADGYSRMNYSAINHKFFLKK